MITVQWCPAGARRPALDEDNGGWYLKTATEPGWLVQIEHRRAETTVFLPLRLALADWDAIETIKRAIKMEGEDQ